MPKLADTAVPRYRCHKASGQAVVWLEGKEVYLGRYGSPGSKAEYNRVVAEWLAAGRRLCHNLEAITVAELVAAFRKHAQTYYHDAEGKVSRTVADFDNALRPLLKLYGRTAAGEFGPLRLKTVRQSMIAAGWVRSNVNRQVTRIKGVFKWAVGNEIISASVYQTLAAVTGLRRGRSEARESEPIKPVPIEYVNAILPHVSPVVKSMIKLQLLTGMRPGELVIMRGVDLETTGRLWAYRPSHHKTTIHGHAREIYLGPQAQAVLKPLLKADLSAYVFSPADAERARRQVLHAARKTPASCGNVPGSNKAPKPKRMPGVRYDVAAYRRAIAYGCERAFGMPENLRRPRHRRDETGVNIPESCEEKALRLQQARQWRATHIWSPHQLRHTFGTLVRRDHGLEAAQVALGHATVSAAQIYAQRNAELAKQLALQVG